MQSFLQYRRFRSAVEAQLERDRGKESALGRSGTQESHSPASSSESKQDLDEDVERKGHTERDTGLTPSRYKPNPDTANVNEKDTHDESASQPRQEPREEPEHADEEEEDDEDDDFELTQARRTLSRTTTQQSGGTALGQVLSGIEVRKLSTRDGGEGNVFVVGYEGPDDPNDPHNWPTSRRIMYTAIIAGIGAVVGFASSITSSALPQASAEFGVSNVFESAATGLYLCGFGLGALFAGPVSETVGRNPVYIGTMVPFMIFVMASALAPNIGAQLAFRFLAGMFGSTPLTCAGGSVSDLWSAIERVFAFPVFANAAFSGPLLGPIIGGFIAESSAVSWRFVEWTTLMFSGVIFTLIRQESLAVRLKRALYRPFLPTAREPIIILFALYLTVIYIIFFTFLNGYTYIFDDNYNLSHGIGGLCFVGIIIGLFSASALVPLIYKWAKRDLPKIRAEGGERLPPEFRLWYSMLGGSFALPISLFWMGWTARPDIPIWSPLAASVLCGYGILTIFITIYQYLIDAYETFAASALVSITVIRYVASGGFAVIGVPWYENIGAAYVLTILGAVSAVLSPVPFLFWRYGPWIRSKSKYAIGPDVAKE
ncbi:unnamed protein product [Zymoseptoria tritici ST99CH_1A5]|uniref:Major facilitator superfamily (MFS) profile domain-containing protein n=1 Tax=Zymoseptoria tritici ST99CH_1A5 TaxID=1276529 RepID=A0A1Y6LGI7_ZYMTR|nr:unnamed protein product [Zymoseptoria tritici ST99CH_1A5]